MKGQRKSCGCLAREASLRQIELMKKIREKDYVDGTCLYILKNDKPYANNKIGVRGVHMVNNRYYVEINFKSQRYRLGSYEDINDAIKVRKTAKEIYFKPVLEKYNVI